MTCFAQFGAIGPILFAASDAVLARDGAFTALLRAINFCLLVFGKQS